MSTATAIIVGSGPAAAGAALALTAGGVRVTVLDVGTRLEDELVAAAASLAARPQPLWTAEDVERIARQPQATRVKGLPEKRAFGSDFPFRDVGQLAGIDTLAGTNRSVVSSAYGGFSNVWGAQVMPFSEATFDTWPVSLGEMEAHYRAVSSSAIRRGGGRPGRAVPAARRCDATAGAVDPQSPRARSLRPAPAGDAGARCHVWGRPAWRCARPNASAAGCA